MSTLTGLNVSGTPFILKTRSDIVFSNNEFASISEDNFNIFDRPLTVLSVFSVHPEKFPTRYHPLDIVQFGTKKDMIDFWNTPLFSEKDILLERPVCDFSGYLSPTRYKMLPEQVLTVSWLQRHGFDARLRNALDLSAPQFELWNQVLQGNYFHVVAPDAVGVKLPSKFASKLMFPKRLISTHELAEIRNSGLNRKKLY